MIGSDNRLLLGGAKQWLRDAKPSSVDEEDPHKRGDSLNRQTEGIPSPEGYSEAFLGCGFPVPGASRGSSRIDAELMQ